MGRYELRSSKGCCTLNDKALGGGLLVWILLGLVVYLYLKFFSPWPVLTVKVTAFTAVAALMSIVAWIGYSMATKPPLGPLEDLLSDNEDI